METVTDLRPRWLVTFKRPDMKFSAKFSNIDDMLKACGKATRLGFKMVTIPIHNPPLFEQE